MVRFRKILYRGRYQKPARTRYTLVLTGVAVLILAIFAHYAFAPSQSVYYLPKDEVPVFQVPKSITSKKDPKSVDDLVSTCYEFSIVAGDQKVFISCPVIHDDGAQDFNSMAVNYLNNVVSNTTTAIQWGNPIVVKAFNYQAFYDLEQNILTVILLWETQDEDRNEIWIFDLTEDRLLEAAELPARFLGSSYAQFLLATDTYIVQRFSEQYFTKSMSDEESQYNYSAIIDHIPSDLSNMATRYVFPSDGKLYLAYELPILCDQYGRLDFRTSTHIDVISEELLESLAAISSSDAVGDLIYGSAVHIMGGSDQTHSALLRQLILEDPVAFIRASTHDPSYAIQRLLSYAAEEECNAICKLCSNLMGAMILTEEEISVVRQLLSEMN